MAQLARGLTNKLLHAPSVQMKKMSAEGRIDALALAQELFALDERAAPLTGTYACMKASLLKKLDVLSDRYEELTALLGDAEVISDQTRFRRLLPAESRRGRTGDPGVPRLPQGAGRPRGRPGVAQGQRPGVARPRRGGGRRSARRSPPSATACSACCCRRIPTTAATCFWKSVPAPVATRRRSSPATCSACIRATPSARAGGSRRCRRTRASTVATRK